MTMLITTLISVFIFYMGYKLIIKIDTNSKKIPENIVRLYCESYAKEGDKFVAECKFFKKSTARTPYGFFILEKDEFMSECKAFYKDPSRVLSKTFHSTRESALEKAKKDLSWFKEHSNFPKNIEITYDVYQIT